MEIITYGYHFESFRMKKKILSKPIKCNGGSGLDGGTERKKHISQKTGKIQIKY